MQIKTLIDNFISIKTQSETEVRTKFVNPLFELLDYPIEFRSEEFPVYGYEGGKKIHSKSADILFFNSNNFATNRSRIDKEIKWVFEHSLLVVEIKKQGESIDVEGQAIYYSAWTRTPLYIITNGEYISFYKVNSNFSDELILHCHIKDIPDHWTIIESVFSFHNSIKLKETTNCINEDLKSNVYMDYCNNLIVTLNQTLKSSINRSVNKKSTNYFETVLTNPNNEHIEYHKMLENDKAKVIVSTPGGGKSYLLNMLAREKLSKNKEIFGKVPILIKCEYFGTLYTNVVDAIYNELIPFNPYITKDYIKSDLLKGNFILLFDALDEVKINKRTLIENIRQYISTTNEIIITVRKENYQSDFGDSCDLYEIDPLKNEMIAKYIYDNTITNISIHQLVLDEKFMDLLATPLFLYIVVQIINTQNGNQYRLPKNKSLLFEQFLRYPLINKLSAYELNILEEILANYAEFLMCNQESDSELITIIQSVVGKNQCEKYYELCINSGIMVKGVNGYKFFHYSFLEYFYARELSKKTNQEIDYFLSMNVFDKNYFEIICLLVGIISDTSKQNYVLDYLQSNSLPLFIKTLESRYKFERYSVEQEFDYSYEYFMQIRTTYIKLIDEYFIDIRDNFIPYVNDFNNKTNKIKLVGKIDYEQLKIYVKFEITTMDDVDVAFTKLNGSPKVYIENSTTELSILSMTTSDGNYFYDLKNLFIGIDSAREIALRILKDQLFKIIDTKISLDMGNNILMAETVESVLEYLNKKKLLPQENIGISLYKNPNEVQSFFRVNCNMPPINDRRFKEPKLPFIVYTAFCDNLISSGVNSKELLPLKHDLNHSELQGNIHFTSDFYSDCQLSKAINRIILLTETSYNKLIELKFSRLKNYMKNYNNYYYKLIWIQRNKQYGANVDIINIKVPKEKTCINTVTNEDGPRYPYIQNELVKKKLDELACTENDIDYSVSSCLDTYLEAGVFHKRVYDLLRVDFEKILGTL